MWDDVHHPLWDVLSMFPDNNKIVQPKLADGYVFLSVSELTQFFPKFKELLEFNFEPQKVYYLRGDDDDHTQRKVDIFAIYEEDLRTVIIVTDIFARLVKYMGNKKVCDRYRLKIWNSSDGQQGKNGKEQYFGALQYF